MKKRILDYRRRVDAILRDAPPGTDWDAVLEEHLVQIGFFQHERLVHLLVTLAFAVFTLGGILAVFLSGEIGAAVLTVLFLILFVPYVMHYYLLENEVQKMYEQYDEMKKHVKSD